MSDLSPMQKHDQIDVVSLSPDGASIILSLVETREWDANGEHLFDVQAKFNTYLEYVESGQLAEQYPESQGKAIVFRLHSALAPDERTNAFLSLVEREWLRPRSIAFVSGRLTSGA